MGLFLMMLSPAAFAVVAPTAVPEPSTLGLFAAAAVGASVAARLAKRRRK